MENFDGSEDARNRQGVLLFGVENGRFIDVSLQKKRLFFLSWHRQLRGEVLLAHTSGSLWC